jgi:hypothetical protein
MSDSKGAAIARILDKFKEETEDLWDQFMEGDSPAPQKYDDFLDNAYKTAQTAILAILAQEVNKARIDELKRLLGGDGTLGNSLLIVPDHPNEVRVVDVSQEWLADELNYRPRRAIRATIQDRIKDLERLG